MNNFKPYLLRAAYEWIEDSELTPYILVDCRIESVDVPKDYIENNKIVLNIASVAIDKLSLGNDFIKFFARFDKISEKIVIPIDAVLSIYAIENKEGIWFDEEVVKEIKKPKIKKEKPTLTLLD